jgi:protocatechuate 3,4-dioxygenase beta subunit
MRLAALLLFSLTSLFSQNVAQNPPDAPNKNGANPATLAGIVKDANSDEPVAGARVDAIIDGGDNRRSTTDSQGHYSFDDLTAGRYRIAVNLAKGGMHTSSTMRNVTLEAGQHLNFDIPLSVNGTISGKVVDENGEPLPGISLFLIGMEYHAGALRTLFKSAAESNDQGEYTLPRVEPGRPYVILAEHRTRKIDAISAVPEDPKMRRQALAPTFYPNSHDLNGAASVRLRSGENLEAIDIKMTKTPGYCVDGTVGIQGVPGPLNFSIGRTNPTFGTGFNSGFYSSNPSGNAGPDGRIRVCDLPSGVYTLEALAWPKSQSADSPPPPIGDIAMTIVDHDIHGVKVEAIPALPIQGEVVWDGTPPEQEISGKLSISLNPLVRAHFQGEKMNAATPVPGMFTLAAVPEGEYSFFRPGAPEGTYVKDITYAGVSVLRGTLRVGSSMGNAGLRVIVANGAAKINVTDKDGNPMAGVNVAAMPTGVTDEAALAASLATNSTDQDGNCTLARLEPGKYRVIAFSEALDMTPELIGKLLRGRVSKATEVEVGPAGQGQVAIKVATLR